jgi:glycosyltransferase involved in cell wall biosynthesis
VHPLSLIEAMAAGLPILGIDSPGVGDIVSDGVTGFLSPSEDLATFTAKMVRLVTDDRQREAMAKNARKRAMNFAVERAGSRLLDLYQELVDRSHTRKQGFRAALNRFMERWRV